MMPNIISHSGDANQNHSEIPFHTHQDGYNKKERQLQVLVKKNENVCSHKNLYTQNIIFLNKILYTDFQGSIILSPRML